MIYITYPYNLSIINPIDPPNGTRSPNPTDPDSTSTLPPKTTACSGSRLTTSKPISTTSSLHTSMRRMRWDVRISGSRSWWRASGRERRPGDATSFPSVGHMLFTCVNYYFSCKKYLIYFLKNFHH